LASTAILLLTVLGTALAMPQQFGIHDLQRRQGPPGASETGSCDESWNLTSCMTCEYGQAVLNEPGYMWVRCYKESICTIALAGSPDRPGAASRHYIAESQRVGRGALQQLEFPF
jgi:hypothetical protein